MRSFFKARKMRKNPFKKALVATLLAASVMAPAMANPSGPQVSNGQVNISGLGGSTMNVEQLTDRAIVNWNSFSIGAQEAVRFLQPSQMAIILNRVTGQDPSQILGSLSANGQVFLINPNGILFGPNSTVDVGGLVASTLGLSDQDFLNGRYNFTQDPAKELASIINQGTIRISDGGYAVLTAPLVSNEGLIVANLGKVVLAGGEKTTLNFDGRNLISYEVGALNGDPGTVLLPKEAVGGMLADMLGAEDRAGKLVQRADGTMALEGGSGLVFQGGVAAANGAAGQQAGTVAVDAARLTVLGDGSVTSADGVGQNSAGGSVYALSNLDSGTTVGQTGSLLSARGGDSGDGGFIEFSGAHFLLGSARDASATDGLAGTFFLDPTNISIIDGAIGGSTITGVTDTITDGDINNDLTTMNVSLQADNAITFNTGVAINGPNNLKLEATGGSINFSDSTVTAANLEALAGGSINLQSTTLTATTSMVLNSGGSISNTDIGSTRSVLIAPNLGLQAGNDISSDITDRNLHISADNLAVNSNGFSVVLTDNDGGLNLVSTINGPTLSVTTGGNAGELGITSAGATDTLTVQASPGFDYGYFRSNADIVLQSDITVTDSLIIKADLDGNGSGGISQTAGLITVPFDLGLSAGDGGIGTAGALTGAIRVDTANLTLATTGNANVVDTAGGVTLIDDVTLLGEVLPDESVTGNTAGGSMQVTATGGDTADLTIQGNIDSVGTNADLAADNDVNFQTGTVANVKGNLVVRADLDNNNNGRIDLPDGAISHLNAPNVGLAQSEDFGDVGGTAVNVNFTNFAIDTDPNGDGTGGSLYVVDNTGDFTLAPITGALLSVSQSRAPSSARFEAGNGALNVNSDITVVNSGGKLDLTSLNNMNLGAVTVKAGDSTAGTTTLKVSGGSLTQTQGGLVSSHTLAIQVAGGNVGTPGGGTDVNAFDIATSFLNYSVEGSANILDTLDLTTIGGQQDQLGALIGDIPLNTVGTLELETRGNFVQDATHTIHSGESAEIVADGNADFNDQVDVTTGNLVVRAGGALRGHNSTFTASAIGVAAGGNIEDITNGPLKLATSQVSYSGNAGVNITNVAGDLTLATGVTAVDETVSGASSNGVTTVTVPNGNLNVNTTVSNTSTGSTELRATDDITFNAGANTPGGSLVVVADSENGGSGNIFMPGMVTLTAANVGLSAGQEIGSSTNPININAGQLALETANGGAFVSNTSSAIALVNQIVGSPDTITGNSVTGDFFLTSTGGITVSDVVAAPEIALVSTAGGITVNQNVGDGTAKIVVLSALGDISGAGLARADEVGLDANNIGSTGTPFNFQANLLTVDAEGNSYLQTTGAVTLADTVMATALNTTVNGNDAVGDFRLLAGGKLDVGSTVTGGDITLSISSGDIVLGADVGDAGTVNTVLRAAGNIENGATVSTTTSQNLGLAATNIGASGNAIIIDANNLSLAAGNDAFIADSDDLTLVDSVTATAAMDNVAGNTVGNNVQIVATGNLNINAPTNGLSATNLELISTGGDLNQMSGNIVATNIAVLTATNNLIQAAGPTVNAPTVGLQTINGNIGTPGPDSGAIDINATNLVLSTLNGSANVRDLSGGVALVNDLTSVGGTTVTGTDISGSLQLSALGTNANLAISDDVTVGQGADLVADGDVIINNNVSVTNNLVIIADNDNDNSGAITGSGSVTSAGLGLAAAGNIDDGSGGPLVVDVNTFAVKGSGNVFVEDQTGSFTVDSVTGVTRSVSVAQAGGDLRLVASGGDLILNTQASAGNNLGLNSITNVQLNANVNAPSGSSNVVIVADSDNNGSGGITQAGGTTVTGSSIGLSAGQDIGTSGSPIQISAASLAAETAGGSVFVSNTANGLSLVDQVTGLGTTVTGNTASANFGVSTAGLLTVDDNVTADQVALTSTNNGITLNQDVTGSSAVVLKAIGGDLSGNGLTTAPSIGLGATNIGTNSNAQKIQANNLTLAALGNANVEDTSGGLTLVNQVTAAGQSIDANGVLGSLQLAATGGDTAALNLASDITIGGSADLVADDDVIIGAAVSAKNNIVVIADNDNNNNGAIRTNGGSLSAVGIGLQSNEDIGDPSGNPLDLNVATLAVDADGNNDQTGGSVNVRDLSGDLTLGSVTGVNRTVSVARAAGSLKVATGEGNLNVNLAVTSGGRTDLVAGTDLNLNSSVTAGGDAALSSQRDLTLGANITSGGDISLVAGRDVKLGGSGALAKVLAQAGQTVVQAPNGNIVVRAGQDITTNGLGQLKANQLGLAAGRDAGSIANPITFDAQSLSYNVGNDIIAEDSAGGLNLVSQVTALNETVNGNTAGRDSRVVANNGNLTSQAATTVGRNGELVTKGSGDVVVDADYTAAKGNVVLRSAGDIRGTGKVTAVGLGLDAPKGTIGSTAAPLTFDSSTLTVGSRPFAVKPVTAFQRAPQVTAIVETVKDVGPDAVVSLPPAFFLPGSTFAQDNVNLAEAVLQQALDNYDLIYTDDGWQVIDDQEFGTTRR